MIVLKQQPLGGVRAALAVAEAAGVPAVVSSMIETSVGIAAGVALAAALPELPYACGLATLGALPGDVTGDPLAPVDGVLAVRAVDARRRPAGALRGPGGEQVSDRLGLFEVAGVPGARERPRRARAGSAAAIRSAMSTYLVSRSPTTSSTGTASSPSRSQFDGCAPWPSTRSWWVSDSTVLPARRSSTPARSRGSDANSGCASQRSRNASTPSRSISCASRSSASRRAARSAASAMPGDALTSTSRSTVAGRSSASCRASRPPIEYPT